MRLDTETILLKFEKNGKVEKTPFDEPVSILQLTLHRGSQTKRLPIVDTHPSISNKAWLLWAGDLDGDGHIDLLIQDAFYEASSTRLFLSSVAKQKTLLKEVAQFHVLW